MKGEFGHFGFDFKLLIRLVRKKAVIVLYCRSAAVFTDKGQEPDLEFSCEQDISTAPEQSRY